MTVQFDEFPQWTDSSGTPLTSGKIYIGTVNLAPKTNTISIFSDRDLTVSLSNPQTLDSFGKATTRIFIPGKYSYLVEDSAEVQVELELDAGAQTDTGTTALDSVLGTNTITASGTATTVTAYDDKEVYTFKVANTNTGAVTLDIDSVGAKAVVKNFNQALDGGDFTQNQVVRAAYNLTSDNFAWVDASVKTKRVTKGSDIASASSITVPDNDGNYFDITGTTTIATINGVAGTYYTFQMDGAVTFTDSSGLTMIGNADFTSAAGDILDFYQLTSTTVICTNVAKTDGEAVTAGQIVQIVNTQTGALATGTTLTPFDDTIPQNTEGNEFMTLAITPTNSSNILIIEVIAYAASSISGVNSLTTALFQDSTAGALAAAINEANAGDTVLPHVLRHKMAAGTTSSTTFKIRIGGQSTGTTTFNGQNAGRLMGGVLASSITITESRG